MWTLDISPRSLTIRLSDSSPRSMYICPTWLCVPHQHFSTNSSLAWLLLSQLPCPTACNYHSLCNTAGANGFTCSMGLLLFWMAVKGGCYITVFTYIYIYIVYSYGVLWARSRSFLQVGVLVFGICYKWELCWWRRINAATPITAVFQLCGPLTPVITNLQIITLLL